MGEIAPGSCPFPVCASLGPLWHPLSCFPLSWLSLNPFPTLVLPSTLPHSLAHPALPSAQLLATQEELS